MSDEWGASLFPSLLERHLFHLAVKTWLSACVSATYSASQRHQERGPKRPNVHYEADFHMKHGARCCENVTADPAAHSEAEVDDRPTAVQGLLPGQGTERQGRWGWRPQHPCDRLAFFLRKKHP